MSGHNKWSTIKQKKGKNDAARAKIFTKIGRELAVAVRDGGSADPTVNSKLRDCIAKAKANKVAPALIRELEKSIAALEELTEATKKSLKDMSDEEYCKNIIPIIPIQMIESWMMADKELLKRQINASYLSDNDLELHRNPEMYADPKQAIENAILIAQRNSAQRRRNAITIADLYEELGNMIELDSLRLLPSFQDFEEKARVLFRKMGYLE